MPGYRLGNGTESDRIESENRGLPPSFSPLNPLHYLYFLYWSFTFSLKDLQLSKKFEFDYRLRRIIPWFISVVLWASILFYLCYVVLVVIPTTTKTNPVFPSSYHLVSNDTISDGSTKSETASNIEKQQTSDDSTQTNPAPPVSSDMTNTSDTTSNTTSTKASQLHSVFVEKLIGKPGLLLNLKLFPFEISSILASVLISIYLNYLLGGGVSFFVAFFVGTLLQTKIFYWLSEPTIIILFMITRFIESLLLFGISNRLKLFYSNVLSYMSPLVALHLSFFTSLAMMASESQLASGTSFILPIFIILVAIQAIPLLRMRLNAREANLKKMELYLVILAPFCIATLLNWWFHLSWFNEIAIPLLSYKNTMVIYCVGLITGVILVLSKVVPPILEKTRVSSWIPFLVTLDIITHIALLNQVIGSYSLI